MKKTKLSWMLRAGASLVAIGAASPAFAQDVPEEDVSEEIVVTATGRTAALQDVPIAVTAINGEAIENAGVQDLRDVQQLAPSLTIGTGQSNSSGTIARIRGIGTGSDNPGFEAAVGIFIDGVYRARAGAAISDLPEVERVEVLRGPQGTLFGRNTSAGAISVVTAGPSMETGMWLEGQYGFDDLEEGGLKAGGEFALSDNVGMRFDGTVRARDGYITDTISGDDINTRDRWTARGQMLVDLNADASLRIIVDGAGADEVCCAAVPFLYGDTQAVVSLLTAGAGTPAIDPEARNATVTPGRDYSDVTDEVGISGELNWDLGFANLTSITAYRDWSADRNQDVDFNLVDIAYRDGLEVGFENITQEIRLQGESGRLNWLVGAFYADEQLDTTDTIRVGTMANLYTNTVTIGGTNDAPPDGFGPPGCELYDFNAPVPSLFQCALVGIVPLLPGVTAQNQLDIGTGVMTTNGGYLLPNVAGQGQQADQWAIDTQSFSLFTHNEFSFTDSLVLTVGARYSNETKDLTADLTSGTSTSCDEIQDMEDATNGFYGGPNGPGIITILQNTSPGLAKLMNLACNPAINTIANGVHEGQREESELSGTASLAWHMSDDVMFYGGYSRGYKAGGFNVDRSGFDITPATIDPNAVNTEDLEFEPEFTDSYELGVRSTFGNTTLNVTGFYQQIHDYQSNNFNGFNFITENVPEVISQGVEVDFRTRITDQLSIEGGVNYTDAHYDSTVIFNPLDPDPNTISSGDPLSFSPELSASGAITYVQPLGNGLNAMFYLDGRYSGEYRTQTLNRQTDGSTDQGAFAVFNGRIGIGPDDDRWSVEFWGRNLTDEFYLVGAFDAPLQDTTYIYPSEPQTYGITVRARY
jgi:iron complex outermembrane recepter protein